MSEIQPANDELVAAMEASVAPFRCKSVHGRPVEIHTHPNMAAVIARLRKEQAEVQRLSEGLCCYCEERLFPAEPPAPAEVQP